MNAPYHWLHIAGAPKRSGDCSTPPLNGGEATKLLKSLYARIRIHVTICVMSNMVGVGRTPV
jgi:hypothetical protein